LVQTGQLDTAALTASRDHLTPAADIYSLAKTTYTLLAGESPRRFAQHRITELPLAVCDFAWSSAVLRVLKKATQSRPEERYQTVEEFWDSIAEAGLAPTNQIATTSEQIELGRRPSADLLLEPNDFTEPAPPRPQFATPKSAELGFADVEPARRPRIVVPISSEAGQALRQRGKEKLGKDVPANGARKPMGGPGEATLPVRRGKQAVVAFGLILAFSGMLLATHKYVSSHWNPLSTIPQLGETFMVGREGVTTTDVNLRPVANTANAPIGLAESGSKVKVLSADNNWYEVQVVAHGRPKSDPYSADRGWISKKFVRFD
jgi:hypothetical protein